MKKIIVNGKFLLHKTTGVERHAREILQELDKQIANEDIVLAIPKGSKDIPNYQNIKIEQVGLLTNNLWEQISFPIYVKKNKAISLNLCNASPLIDPGVVNIHDVKVKAKPEYFNKIFSAWYNLLFKNDVKRAKYIITVSNFSKKEIIKYFHADENKITVIPNAWQHYEKIKYDENALNKYNLKRNDYYFSMSSLEPNKNFKWIAEVAKKNPNQEFAIAGSINSKVFSEGLGFDCPNNMKLLGFVSDEEAKTLMRDCKAFIFPTYYEGFGLPPMEAISAGCKSVIVSDSEVMHEIFGDGVEYIDPDIYELDDTLVDLNKDKILSMYSWSKSANLLMNLLHKVGGVVYNLLLNRHQDETFCV